MSIEKSIEPLRFYRPANIQPAFDIYRHLNDNYLCPYCLHDAPLISYLIPRRRGYSHNRAICPDCSKMMRMPTLTRTQTLYEYVTWLQDMAPWDNLSNHIKWDKIKERLRARRWSSQFWDYWYDRKRSISESGGDLKYHGPQKHR